MSRLIKAVVELTLCLLIIAVVVAGSVTIGGAGVVGAAIGLVVLGYFYSILNRRDRESDSGR